MRHPPVQVPAGICYGRTDLPLLPGWQDEIPGLAETAARIRPSLVVASPLSRCLLPARALAARLGLPVRIDDDLCELDFGDWEGLAWERVPRAALDRWAADPAGFAPPGGESGQALIRRIDEAAGRLRDAACNALVVSHGGPLRLLGPMLRGEAPDLLAPAPAMGRIETLRIG
jgi:alpha-ribazole phosphatase